MKLTRRDALRALVVGGGAAGGSLAVSELLVSDTVQGDDSHLSTRDIETLHSVAEVVYPSEVMVTVEFIETYTNRLDDDRLGALTATISELDSVTNSTYGDRFAELPSRSRREQVLRSLGVDRVPSRPDGTVPERVRYHLVNSLLYALFTTPKGSKLAGVESPRGHAGGFAPYRKMEEEPTETEPTEDA